MIVGSVLTHHVSSSISSLPVSYDYEIASFTYSLRCIPNSKVRELDQLEVGTHEQPALEGGTHEPTPTKVLNVKNIREWTFVRASFKCRLFVKVNFSMAHIL